MRLPFFPKTGVVLLCFLSFPLFAGSKPIVFQTDFGLKDGAVSAMKGVSIEIDHTLKLFDLTHEIPAYNVWEASYRLYQTLPYWPKGTVFVSVVDPGVGTVRPSVVLKTKSGHYVVTPDNGTLTLVADNFGIDSIREIDEAANRRKNSEKSYTFHGRDVYSYTAARLASEQITFEQVGRVLPNDVFRISYQKPSVNEGKLLGTIPALDVQYGNVWSNIDRNTAAILAPKVGKSFDVSISHQGKIVFQGTVPFANSFGDVKEGGTLLYYNSLDNLSIALNLESFAEKYGVQAGGEWQIQVAPIAS